MSDVIGRSRIELTGDSSGVVNSVNQAKQSVQSLVTEVDKASTRQTAANKRVENSLLRQVQTYGLSREEVLRFNIAQRTTGETATKLTQAMDAQVKKLKEAASVNVAAATEQENAALQKQIEIRDRLSKLLSTARGQKILEAEAARSIAAPGKPQLSEGQLRFARQSTPAQIQDFLVQVQGGQSPLTALFQQGSQLQGLYGSVGGAIKGVAASIMSVVNPVTVSAAAIAGLGYAAYKGAAETNTLNEALIKTGNAAGITTQSLIDSAGKLDEVTGVTTGKAVEVLAQLAATGEFTGAQMDMAGEAALKWSVATGTAVEDVISNFSKIADDPVKALIALDKQLNFANDSQIAFVQSLVESGRQTEAANQVMQLYSDTLKKRSEEVVANLGYMERAWRNVTNAAKESWDAIKSVGRDKSTGERIKELRDFIDLETRAAKFDVNQSNNTNRYEKIKEAQEELRKLNTQFVTLIDPSSPDPQAQRRAKEANAKLRDENARAEEQAALSSKSLAERLEAEKTRLHRLGVTDRAAIDKALQIATDKFNDSQRTKSAGSASDGGLGAARLSAIKAEAQDQKKALEDQTQDLKQQYADREVSAKNYYAGLRDLAIKGTDVEVASIQKQISELEKQTGARQKSGAIAVQIQSLQERSAALQEQGAARVSNITKEEVEASEKRAAGLKAYRDALDATTKAMADDYDSKIRSIGLGDRQFEIETKINAVLADKAKRLREIAQQEQARQIDPEAAAANRSSVEEAAAQQVETIKSKYTELQKVQGDALLGLSAGLQNYVDEAGNVAGAVKSSVESVAKGLEDVFVTVATTGKLSFKDMANSILADLARIAAKKAVSSLFSTVLGGIGGGTGSAAGGILSGFASGGYTGPGGVNDPAGVVHRGEIVWSQSDIAKAGGVAAVEAMRQGKKGYAAGGIVGNVSSNMRGIQPNVNVTVIGAGSDGAKSEAKMGPNGDLDINVFLGKVESQIASNVATGRGAAYSAIKSRFKVEDRK
ncbi:putative tail length tape measure protein [Xanthomonas phage OP1]|uniref:Tail length tape measure protein n=1 Tax=Xanthomonas phage OP1 TaxID=2994040 RepID=Q2NPH4_9CAUD|nr:tail length tape measure protein [Xanthomonas phage OP1]BAE72722.1 putative tail length tape measure protein [Xanthomonas phage OP1]